MACTVCMYCFTVISVYAVSCIINLLLICCVGNCPYLQAFHLKKQKSFDMLTR